MRKTHYKNHTSSSARQNLVFRFAQNKPHRIKRRKSIFRKPVFWLLFLFSFLVAGGIYFFVFFEKFQISKIIISGNEKVQTGELEKLVFEKIKQKLWLGIPLGDSQSIFLVNSAKIKRSILEQYPNIDTVATKRKFPNTIIVDIKERKPFVILCGFKETKTETCFFLDEKGIAFERDATVTGNLTIVRQFEEKEIVLGKEVVKKEIMESIYKIQKNLEENLKLKIEEFNISSPTRLDVKTIEGWWVYFSTAFDIDLQITKLNLLLEKEISQEDRGVLKYIDLRFKDRAYYK